MKTTKSVWGKALVPAVVVLALALLVGLPFLKSRLFAQPTPPPQTTTCHATGAVADPNCYPFAFPCYSGQAFWLAGLDANVFSIPCSGSNPGRGSDGFKYIFTAGAFNTTPTFGTFTEFPNGTATLTGHIESSLMPGFGFDVTINFSGFTATPNGNGRLLELNANCYGTGPGQVDPNTWHFYTTATGTLTGTGNYMGANVSLTDQMHLPQFGNGANGKNLNPGGSSWFSWLVNHQPNNPNFRLNLTNPAGQSVDFNIDCTPCTGVIGDFVWQDTNGNGCQDAGEPGMANVQVDLFSGCGGTQMINSTMTDSTGHYQFTGLCAGTYSVCFHTPTGFIHTVANATCNINNQPSDSTDSDCMCTGDTSPCCVCVTLATDSSQDLTIDCGYIPRCRGSIGDFVWNDLNGNGCQDTNEPGIANVKVELYQNCGSNLTLLQTQFTDQSGHYLFQNLCAGNYTVRFYTPSGFAHTIANAQCNSPSDSNDSDCMCTGTDSPCDVCVNLPDDMTTNLTIDCGYITQCPPCVNPNFGLGAGAAFSVFELGGGNVSVTGPAGGLIGDIAIGPNRQLSMSGDEFVTGTIKLAPGATFSNSAHFTPTVQTNVDLTAAINAAKNLSMTDAALPCDQTFTKVDGSTVTNINATHAGQNVICIKDVSISGKQVFINNPSNFANVTFVLNITGQFALTGGGNGPQIRAGTNVKPADILYNLVGNNTMNVAFSGGGGGTNCCAAIVDGTLLAVNRDINLSPGLVNGEVIGGKNISIVSGSAVKCPVCPGPTPTPTPSATPTPPQQTSNCVNAQGVKLSSKPKTLNMTYEGGSCASSMNSQGPPNFSVCQKFCCTESNGGLSGSSVHIIVSSSSSTPTGTSQRFFEGDVALNGQFTVTSGTNTFGANTYFFIYEGGVLKQMVQLHTSCSAPLVRGETFGGVQLNNYSN